jgi:transcriptional regulator with PAS, ATPase and Fis domain
MPSTLKLVGRGVVEAGACRAMIGEHPTMRQLASDVVRAAPLEIPVLVRGETGTGKELLVQALHEHSGRRGRLVSVNLAAVPEHLAESELFGHVRGAFTGATADRGGLIAQAAGGTLYLDEAGDVSPALQAKLLRVLETGHVRPVGAAVDRPVHFRLVVSVQQPAEQLVAAGRWRADFYYRVAGLELYLPRLAERVSDLPFLIDHFLARLGRSSLGMPIDDSIAGYAWPGNVRELRRVVERAVYLAGDESLILAHLRAAMPGAHSAPVSAGSEWSRLPSLSLADAERSHIETVLRATRGDVGAAARQLALPKSTLYRRLAVHGLVAARFRSDVD